MSRRNLAIATHSSRLCSASASCARPTNARSQLTRWQRFCLCVAEQEGGDERGRPSAPRSRWPAATTRPSPSPAPGTTHPRPQLSPAAASPGRSDRGSAHHEMRAVLVVREGGERALGRGGAAAPRAEAHRALELAPDRILPPPARVSQSPRVQREEPESRREMALSAERRETAAHGRVLLRPGLGHLSLGVGGSHRSGDGDCAG